MRVRFLAALALLFALPIGQSQAATTYTYDSLGRLWIVTYDNGMQITYTYDGAGNRTQVVTHTGTALPPQPANDWIKVYGTAPYSFNPLANDTDPNNYTLVVTAHGSAAHGATSHTGSSVGYTPTGSYTGSDSFTYTVSDQHGQTAQATVFVTVSPANPPVAGAYNTSTPKNTAATLTPLSVDSDPLGLSLSIQSAGPANHGTLVNNSGATLTYTPTTNYTGADSFPYTVSDGHGQTATGTINVGVGNPPVAVADYKSTPTNTAVTYDARSNDTDPNGYSLSVTSVTPPQAGATAVINANGTLTYTPKTGASGLDTFTYTITDAHGLTASATDSICVNPGTFTANADQIDIEKSVNSPWTPQATIDPRGNDTVPCNTGPLKITSVTQPSIGSVLINSGTSVTYTYPTEVDSQHTIANASTSFTYTVVDSYGDTSTATVSVTVYVTYGQGQ
jgi:hypothetical protein